MTPDERRTIEGFLDALLENKHIKPMEYPDADMEGIQARMLQLSAMIDELKTFAMHLAAGDVNVDAPSRKNYLASGLKQLQAQMLHLTWQAQCVAQGDYRQKIDFMGDFSKAFNEMVEQLRSRDASLKEHQAVMERIFNMIEPIFVLSEENPQEVLYVNEVAAMRFRIHMGVNTRFNDTLTRIISLPASNLERQIHDEKSNRWFSVIARSLQWGNETNARLFYCRDITTHKQREDSLDTAANTDELTGMNNRRAFDNRYGILWYTCMSARKPISIIVFDLDEFKTVNDTYGHTAGDKVMEAFSRVLKSSISRGDDVIARYGGDEFITALPFTNEENASRIANAVCDMIANRSIMVTDDAGQEVEVRITVSGGISCMVPSTTMQPSQLIQVADTALRHAKKEGRNRIVYLSPLATPPSSEGD